MSIIIKKAKNQQYILWKIPIKEIIAQDYSVELTIDSGIEKEYLVKQGDSPLFNQIERIRNKDKITYINDIILVVAKKNPKQEKQLRYLLENGFDFNGVHYKRFGKSNSQGKEGITAFVCDEIFNELYMVTQMDIPIQECVISKYEAQRNLLFSSCTLIKDYVPNIVIIDEYEKIIPHQLIKYVVQKERVFVDKDTGENKKYKSREVEEGYKDLKISPFDGCGCHEHEFMENVSAQLGLDYNAVGVQVRMPFVKGYSVYVPFREIFKEWGYEHITDIYGKKHRIDNIDCIWNVSMFKGHKIFKNKYGDRAWIEYMNTFKKYKFSLGISKYSHHIKNLNKYTRMNFQYLQCLDLWNERYVKSYETGNLQKYNILDSNNDGKIIRLAKYTTELFEKIIKGDKFYTYKFMGISDTDKYEPSSKYLEAAIVNDIMLKDPAVKQFIYRKLKKAIDETKVGKIYCSGFYHTGVGDMIGYLQYAVGEPVIGCLKEHEIYSGNFEPGDIAAFRSPLVDPSEVNKIKVVHNEILKKWFGSFVGQDMCMFNMYDISAPQMGGADFDGDIFYLCDDPIVIKSKIEKPIIIDVEDKSLAVAKPYIKENLVEYEVMTRDNRIGEITNAATSIENKYTTNLETQKIYSDFVSLLRVMQGKEIDFLKTGTRWQMNKGLRKHLKQLPYFLLYNYPSKMATYRKRLEKNKLAENNDDKIRLNAYHSPSPMNELCEYICVWEKKHVLWYNDKDSFVDTRCLIINNNIDLSNKKCERIARRYINRYADELRKHIELEEKHTSECGCSFDMDLIINKLKRNIRQEMVCEIFANVDLDIANRDFEKNEDYINRLTANYVIKVSYNSLSISKAFAWAAYGDYIIENLKNNSNPNRSVSIIESPYKTNSTYEYLGKYYEFIEGNESLNNSLTE